MPRVASTDTSRDWLTTTPPAMLSVISISGRSSTPSNFLCCATSTSAVRDSSASRSVRSAPLPLRTSLQSSENDEAAQAASSVFLKYNEGTAAYGGRSGTALHLAWYARGFSFEAEWQGGRDHMTVRDEELAVSVPVSGNHFTSSYFLTGETVTGRGWSVRFALRPGPRFLGPGSDRGLRPVQRPETG